ncbi:probable glutathione S-transferase DHAR2, chloroplastic [Selaginella moellendorffii]|uniref:probable glutathione S-transferase DHAR2, chloroplastic n=1 Tax=Selaginella moellendorffii TaxID=88036 RepID=UPI000D1CBCA2|nr:probable glutathione S-transferase DHAR2, chloroplastic [Selaginella moellendorffii]|eukprot:XP_024521306.1 probable glutathione S-transferase DHAR2, chloroplastic [Selaginella moellendorffii]
MVALIDRFMQHNPSGLMPALRDGPDWIQDSDKIIVHVEKKFKEPSLKTPDEFKVDGPYIAGKNPTDSDFALAPKLRHARMALEHFMDFVFPSNLQHVAKYMVSFPPSTRSSFLTFLFLFHLAHDEMIIAGWQTKFGQD